jgi:hypothetical protein
MATNLTSMCMESIVEKIYQAPPMIQEMIIDETKKSIRNKVIIELKEEMRLLISLVPAISKSIILSRAMFFSGDNYYEIYDGVPKHIIQLAIEIAEVNVKELNETFNLLTTVSASASNNRYRFSDSSDDDEDMDNENEKTQSEDEFTY